MNELIRLSELEANSDRPSFSVDSNKANLPANIDILQIEHFNASRNFTCQAQNSFGMIVFNLSLVMKGSFYFIVF